MGTEIEQIKDGLKKGAGISFSDDFIPPMVYFGGGGPVFVLCVWAVLIGVVAGAMVQAVAGDGHKWF